MSQKVVIDQEECTGCETCVELCPEVFGLDEETEVTYVIDADAASEEEIQEAIDSCPVECISWG